MLHLDATPLALVPDEVHLARDHPPTGIVGYCGVPDEAGVINHVWVVLDFVFQSLRLHLCIESFSSLINYKTKVNKVLIVRQNPMSFNHSHIKYLPTEELRSPLSSVLVKDHI